MNNKTLQNLIDNMVLERIKDYYYVRIDDIKDMFEYFCENSDDLDEIMCFVSLSNRYNCVLKQNGDCYILSNKKRDFRAFFEDVEISDNDQVWLDFVVYENKSMLLRDVYEEVK